jgi:hypothetical protein
MSNQELLPPLRLAPTMVQTVRAEPDTVWSTVRALTVPAQGPASSTLTRWKSERAVQTIGALTAWTDAEAAYYDSLNKQMQSFTRLKRTAMELAELPEAFAHEKAVRRTLRANQVRQAQHTYEVDEYQRLTEITHKETDLTAARQALVAQRKYGDSTQELAWKQRHIEMLQAELDAEERRELLRQHRITLTGPAESEEARRERKIKEEFDVILDQQ